jgi:hypothetical protein
MGIHFRGYQPVGKSSEITNAVPWNLLLKNNWAADMRLEIKLRERRQNT